MKFVMKKEVEKTGEEGFQTTKYPENGTFTFQLIGGDRGTGIEQTPNGKFALTIKGKIIADADGKETEFTGAFYENKVWFGDNGSYMDYIQKDPSRIQNVLDFFSALLTEGERDEFLRVFGEDIDLFDPKLAAWINERAEGCKFKAFVQKQMETYTNKDGEERTRRFLKPAGYWEALTKQGNATSADSGFDGEDEPM
jgi:hypothetical protein